MPPKKQEPSKRNKVKVDKTFGMKNKKGAKSQEIVAMIKKQEAEAGDPRKRKEQKLKEQAKKEKKEVEERKKAEIHELFKPVKIQQTAPFGVDPKTILCINFKNGNCERGAKCKFSHDLASGRRTQKKDIYTDDRKGVTEESASADNMQNWDEEKLREVVGAKYVKGPTETDIVCKYFLEAIESEKYGWFWQCPNGERCHYQHALPKGFILNRDKAKRKELEEKNRITLEQFLEVERSKLGSNLNRITLEKFNEWKDNRIKRKEIEKSEARRKLEANLKSGRTFGLSGRQMFEVDSSLVDCGAESDENDDLFDLSQFRKEIVKV